MVVGDQGSGERLAGGAVVPDGGGQGEETLGNWVKAWRDANPEAETALSPVERARVTEMEEEIRRLRMENEFLKKAAAFFARTPQ